jgi:hypothetical protein
MNDDKEVAELREQVKTLRQQFSDYVEAQARLFGTVAELRAIFAWTATKQHERNENMSKTKFNAMNANC